MSAKTFIYAICLLLVLIAIFRVFMMKMDTPRDYLIKSHYMLMLLGSYSYANKILKDALDRFENLTEEEFSFLNFQIGANLFQKRKYEEAVIYFDKSWGFLEKSNIPYNKAYAFIVKANNIIGKKEKARSIYKILRAKEKYDIKFKKLSSLEREIF